MAEGPVPMMLDWIILVTGERILRHRVSDVKKIFKDSIV